MTLREQCAGMKWREVRDRGLLKDLLGEFNGSVAGLCRGMGWDRTGGLRTACKFIAKVEDALELGASQAALKRAVKVTGSAVVVTIPQLCEALGVAVDGDSDASALTSDELDRLKILGAVLQCSPEEAYHAAQLGKSLRETEQASLQRQITQLSSALKATVKHREDAENFVGNIVFQLTETLGILPVTPLKVDLKQDSPGDEEYAMGEWSDWQVGSYWREEDVQGLPAMNRDVLESRVELLVKKTIQLVELQRHSATINDLVLNVLGDMVEGDVIFDSQGVFTDAHGFSQLVTCVNLMERGLRTLLQNFRELRLYCVYGNHGRMGPKKNSQHPQNNWDYLLYMYLAERFRDEPRVKIFVSTMPWMAYNLPLAPKWNHLLLHGDGIPQSLGIPWYGVNRETAKAADIMDCPLHYVHLGHFHQAAQLDKPYGAKIINGCLTGPSPHALKHMLAGLPKQLLFGMHPKVGQTWSYQVYLGERPDVAPDENGIMTSYTEGLTSPVR